jgi:hypothetical protein
MRFSRRREWLSRKWPPQAHQLPWRSRYGNAFPKPSIRMEFPVFRELLRSLEALSDAGRPRRIPRKKHTLRNRADLHPKGRQNNYF